MLKARVNRAGLWVSGRGKKKDKRSTGQQGDIIRKNPTSRRSISVASLCLIAKEKQRTAVPIVFEFSIFPGFSSPSSLSPTNVQHQGGVL